MNWFYSQEGQSLGPVNDAELADLAGAGRIDGSTLVWNAGLPGWRPYDVVGPLPGAARHALPPSSNPGPRYAGTALPYAGFWLRVAAAIFDGLLLSLILIPACVLGYGVLFFEFPDYFLDDDSQGGIWRPLLEIGLQLAPFAVAALYETIFTGSSGATPGKVICNVRVVRAGGGRVSRLRAFCRCFAKILSVAPLGLGYAIIPFDAQKRGLHDYICSTRVIHTPPRTG